MTARTRFCWAIPAILAATLAASALAQSVPPPAGMEVLFSISPRGTGGGWPPFWGGDEVSERGYVVARNWELLRNFNLPETFAAVDYGLDALQELNWGPIAVAVKPLTLFSINQGFTDTKTGKWISDGDLLSTAGTVVATNAQLMARFGPMPPLQDMGLDAVFIPYYRPTAASVLPPEIWFSTNRGWFDERLGRSIGDGDLLSSRGYVVATNAALLRNFHPVPTTDSTSPAGVVQPTVTDYGLDAVYVPLYRPWFATTAFNAATSAIVSPPPLEIWFSVKKGFTDKYLGNISDGDLLSTTGRIVRTNHQLLSKFPNPLMAPILLNYGLDAVYARGRRLVGITPAMDATVSKVADNQVRLVFDGQVEMPAAAAVSVVSLPDGQDITSAFDVSLSAGSTAGDSLVITERGSALANASRFRIQPADAFAVEPFELDIGKLVGDMDGSGAVDVLDLLRLAETWGKSTGGDGFDGTCDLNNDGSVDVTDLLIFADSWGRQTR